MCFARRKNEKRNSILDFIITTDNHTIFECFTVPPHKANDRLNNKSVKFLCTWWAHHNSYLMDNGYNCIMLITNSSNSCKCHDKFASILNTNANFIISHKLLNENHAITFEQSFKNYVIESVFVHKYISKFKNDLLDKI